MTAGTEEQQFGQYRLTHLLGKGGMATVYRALRSGPMGFAKEVAIKRLHESLTENDGILKSLINEARLGGQLKHPNIVEVYEFNKVEETYYLAMEFVDGWTLDRVFKFAKQYDHPIPAEVLLEIFAQVCDGLHYAHTLESLDGEEVLLVHRDMKPANIILSRFGIAKIMDFGIAKAATNLFHTTMADVTKGTPHYMSPEQVAGDKNLTGKSDIYALGAVIYEAVTGEVLFKGENLATVLFAVVKAEVGEQLKALDRRVPGLSEIVAKCLRKDPAERWANAYELGLAILQLRRQVGGTQTIQEYLYSLRGHLIRAHFEAQETDTIAEHLPQFATLFEPASKPAPSSGDSLAKVMAAADASIRRFDGPTGRNAGGVGTTADTRIGGLDADGEDEESSVGTVAAGAPLGGGTTTADLPGPAAELRRQGGGQPARRKKGPPTDSIKATRKIPARRKKKKDRTPLILLGLALFISLVAAGIWFAPGPDNAPSPAPPPSPATDADPGSAVDDLMAAGIDESGAGSTAAGSAAPAQASAPPRVPPPTVASSTPAPATGGRPTAASTPTPGPVAAAGTEPAPAPTPRTDATAALTQPLPTPTPAPTPQVVAAPVSGKPGELSIKPSSPVWARVFIDGRDIGKTTPLIGWTLPPGRHEIRLVAKDGVGEVTRTIQINPGTSMKLGKYDFDSKTWSD